MRLVYKIRNKYKYPEPNNDRIFELSEVNGFVFIFKCGHRVMDSVFEDLVDVKTGLASWQHPIQLSLFKQEINA